MAIAVVALLGLPLPGSTGYVSEIAPPLSHLRPAMSWAPQLRLQDGGLLTLAANGTTIATLTDTIEPRAWSPNSRAYSILLRTALPEPSVGVRLITDPVLQWGNPSQFPGGPDALPTLGQWHWSIQAQGQDDTGNWSSNFQPGTVGRNLTWGNYEFDVVGTLNPSVTIAVHADAATGHVAPAVGYSLNGALSPNTSSANDSDYTAIGQALHPGIVRFGLASSGSSVTWDSREGAPVVGWDAYDKLVSYAKSLPAAIDLTLPVGTWGDGNYLPAGMPLDYSTPIPLGSNVGYFPTATAFASYVDVVANHSKSSGAGISYWTIGNEMPLVNASVVDEYTQLFNVAASTIHARMPNALVGSDVMMNPDYLDRFAANTRGVGFLSFHYYPGLSMCVQGGSYCPPAGGGQGTPNSLLMNQSFDISHGIKFLAPHLAQTIWYNYTGRWLPVFDAESNLNAAGVNSVGYGTDPRQQSLFGGAWLASTLVDAVRENLSSFVYFTLTGPATIPSTMTGPLGGWGFGLSSEGTHDNDTLFAPYWALRLWDSALPAGSPILLTTGTDPNGVEAIATANASGVSILLVNRANLTADVHLTVLAPSGQRAAPNSLTVLDGSSYRENYSFADQAMVLTRSGVRAESLTGSPAHFLITGYEVAVLTASYLPTGNGSRGPGSTGSTNGTTPPPGNGRGSAAGPAPPAHSARVTVGLEASSSVAAATANRVYPWAAGLLLTFVMLGAAATRAGSRPSVRASRRR